MADMNASSPSDLVGTFPTSITQKRAWFMEQIHPGHRGLNIAVRWELRGPVSSDMVEAAFQKIVDRHEILRTRFAERDGEPVQEVVAQVEFKLIRLDIRNLPAADQEEKVRQIAMEHAEEPFDMGRAGLIRVAMVHLERERAALVISVHNSVFDGYSIGVLGHELGTCLEAIETGRPVALEPLELQYGDFALWQSDTEASGAFAPDEAYWRDQLQGMAYFELPPDRPRTGREPESRSFAADLPPDFEARLAETAKALDTSVFALGTCAFSIALERFSGRRDVSFAVQAAGRTEVDLEPLIGIFTNPIVMRLDVDPAATLSDHALKTREVVTDALAHQALPFDRLVQVLNPPRDPLRIPLVSIMFNLQRAFLNERRYGSVELVSVQSHSPGTLYDLNVNIVGRNAGWRMVIDYNADLFDAATIERLSDLIRAAIDELMHGGGNPVGSIGRGGSQDNLALAGPTPLPGAAPAADRCVDPARSDGAGITGQLRRIWAEVLDLPEEAITGSFFDLGGYSVLALRMLARVGDTFEQRPGLHAFLADPSVEGLARLLGAPATTDATAQLTAPSTAPDAPPAATPAAPPATVPAQPADPADTGGRPPTGPVFAPAPDLAPAPAPATATGPVAGPAPTPALDPTRIWALAELRAASETAPVLVTVNQPLLWHALARGMASDCAVANLGVPDLDALGTLEGAGLDAGIDAAAEMIRARYGGRPLLFCGLCVDGRVALRLAQRLNDQGAHAACVAMIDTWAPGAIRAFSRFARFRNRWRIRLRRIRYYLGLRRRGEIGWGDVLRQNDLAAAMVSRLSGVAARSEADRLVDATVDVLVEQTKAYRFAPYDGDVVVFITRSQGLVPEDGLLGWSPLLADDAAAYPIDGWHGETLMRSGFDRIMGVIDARARRLGAARGTKA